MEVFGVLMPFLTKKGYQVVGQDINFFKNSNLFKKNELEKLIQFKDSRTYKVSFDNLNKKFGLICTHSVEDGIKKMIDDLNKLNFNKNIFNY